MGRAAVLTTLRSLIISLFLLTTVTVGVRDGLSSMRAASTSLQTIAVATQLCYAVLGLVGLVAYLVRSRWTVKVLIGWAVAVSATAGLAARAWGGAGRGSATAAGLGAALLSTLIVWGAHGTVEARPQREKAVE